MTFARQTTAILLAGASFGPAFAATAAVQQQTPPAPAAAAGPARPLPAAQAPSGAPGDAAGGRGAAPSGPQPPAAADAPAAEPGRTTRQVVSAAPTVQDSGEILVEGRRPRGSVVGNVPAERTLTPLDIRALGASNLGELLQSLDSQTRSNRGRSDSAPVVLINGRRVSSFREVSNIPPEAIERMEIFPEEVALRYGYRADQKVVNVVTFERYRSTVGQVTFGIPTSGGRSDFGLSANYLQINGDTRYNIDAEYQRGGSLLESERDILAGEVPFDLLGNIGPFPASPGGAIDPALSALAGASVTRAAVPAVAATRRPTLAEFVPGANGANRTDIGDYRTLIPATERLVLNATVSRPIFGNVAASLNARLEVTQNDSLLGLSSGTLRLPAGNPFSPFAADTSLYRYFDPSTPLARSTSGWTGHLGTALNGRLGRWLWSFTGNYDRISSDATTDTGVDIALLQARLNAGDPAFNPFADTTYPLRAPDLAETVNAFANAEAVLTGSPFRLPAGEASATLRAGVEALDFHSESVRSGVADIRDLSRDRGTVQASINLPITSRSRNVLAAIGTLSLDADFELEELSDFGTLRRLGYGLSWSPIDKLSFTASMVQEEAAPTVQQLGDPLLVTPNVRTFDFTRGETADVTRVLGGNPGLLSDDRSVMRLGLFFKPFQNKDLSFTANYTASRIDNPILPFPVATPAIEAAFPDRFSREASGRLVRIDARPVNFTRWDRREMRWGFNFSRALGNVPPGMEINFRFGGSGPRTERPRDVPPGGQVTRVAPGSPEANRLQGLLSRVYVSLYHTWRFQDELVLRPGLPTLDLLDGFALGNRGGSARHEVELQTGIYYRGLGAQASGRWRSGSRIDGVGGGAGDLFFSDYGTLNLSFFANPQERFGRANTPPLLRGVRLSLNITNLFDARPNVRDGLGVVPLGYQPAYLDPLGRTVSLSLRKVF